MKRNKSCIGVSSSTSECSSSSGTKHKRANSSSSLEKRALRPRLEYKEEEGFAESEVKKALLESIYEQSKQNRRRELEKEKRKKKLEERRKKRKKTQSKSRTVDKLPSTRDFIRFISLNYTNDINDLPSDLRTFHSLPYEPEIISFQTHFVNIVLLGFGFIIALLLFQHGFLLKRHEQLERSSCADVTITRSSCWLPRHFERAVIILIDALRYDFIAPPRALNNSSKPSSSHFIGHFPSVAHLLQQSNESSTLLHFIADPPTTTMQRIKALTTGSLPTFIDIGANFASTAVQEDNWVDQIVSSGRNITFLGDDTWTALFPTQFHRHFAMPSFDVNDLSSVDNMILSHIYDELSRPDWSVLVAHFLGVDHCGHKYGPDHEQMARQLALMDEMIENVTERIDNETVLVVMGDHGMTETGDHGGDDEAEIDAALFLYAHKRLLFCKPPNSIAQIDLVPTLSVLLDSPIPYSNIGIISECFIENNLREWAITSNAWQIMRYAQSLIGDLPNVESILRLFDAQSNSIDGQRDAMRSTQSLFRASWTHFNLTFMRIGVLSFIDAFLTALNAILSKKFVIHFWSTYLIGDDERYTAVLDTLLSVSIIWRIILLLSALLGSSLSKFHCISLFVVVAHALSFFSNSYIVFESSQWSRNSRRTNTQTSLFSYVEDRLGKGRLLLAIIVLLSLRVGIVWERCREEQQAACSATQFSLPLTKLSFGAEKAIRFVTGVVFLCAGSFISYHIQIEHCPQAIASSLIFPSTVATVAVWLAEWLPERSATQFASFPIICAQMMLFILLAYHGFFALSHHATFSTIPWQAAFIGVPGNFEFQSVQAALVITHLYASSIITVVALPLSLTYCSTTIPRNALAYRSYAFLIFTSIPVLCTCMAAAIHRRHLMVWAIFAPKFIFEGVSLCVVCITIMFINLVFFPLNSFSVSLPLFQ
ncbi:unnamed protein product [Anisakis simplex]|uniref:GPI ethanolamine phosphate transferase 3 n=1 Tax=Anisakis simplex TaxID=6269 RepID=A0A0M3JU61_ANISI|nr:unnamed protein product [Anisakis simplex]